MLGSRSLRLPCLHSTFESPRPPLIMQSSLIWASPGFYPGCHWLKQKHLFSREDSADTKNKTSPIFDPASNLGPTREGQIGPRNQWHRTPCSWLACFQPPHADSLRSGPTWNLPLGPLWPPALLPALESLPRHTWQRPGRLGINGPHLLLFIYFHIT